VAASRKKKKGTPSGQATSTASGWAAMTSAQRVAWVCLHALVFSVPVAMSNWTWVPGVMMPFTADQFDIVKVFVQRGITLVAFAAWAWHVLVNGGTVRRTKVDYLILAVLGWYALSSIFSIHPPTAIFGKYRRYEGLLSLVTYAMIYFLAVQFLDRLSRVRSIARTLFFSGIIVNGYGVMQYLGLDPLRWGTLPFEAYRSFSTFGNPDLLGGFVVITLAVSLALALSESDFRWRIVYWSGFLIGSVCWITAFTRGAWIGGAVALIALGVAVWRMRGASRMTRVDWSFAGAIVAAVSVLVVRSLQSPDPVMNVAARLGSILEFDQGSALTRFQIWDAAWRATLDRPIFGFGPDTFRLVFPGYKPIEYTEAAGYLSVADNVHNYFLQLSSSVGIPGMLLLYGLFASVAVLSARNAFKRAESDKDVSRLILAGMWAASAGYVVKLFFGLSVTGVTFLLWIAMAALMAPLARTVEIRPPSWGVPAALVIFAVAAVASWGNLVYLMADNAHLQTKIGATYEERVASAETAIRRNPFNDIYRAELGLVHAEAFSYLASQIRLAENQGQDATMMRAEAQRVFNLAEAEFLETIEFVEYEYDNYVFLANLYNNGVGVLSAEYNEKALAIGRRGIAVSEFGPAIRLQYAIALLDAGDIEEAERQMRAAVEMDSRFADTHMLLAEILAQRGDAAGALEYYQKVKAIDPAYPGIDEMIARVETVTGD